ncbi:hypothetical protein PDE_05049 [Penicillium oxalicum 114-2]|uniref:Uncharacterized protein n=1 Tax=Penicillium oxalicum (strain 114-2 / CGMCC 5302) TaxID=933388 RepID=S7ZII2_PENO1|nr:hypothetical protein PDE_05049 [Penicillium oxalicum 114-2]
MCPTIVSRLSNGPAMVLSPSQEHVFGSLPSQSLLDAHSDFHTYSGTFNSTFGVSKPTQPSMPVQPQPSRKRSRDEAAVDESSMARGPCPSSQAAMTGTQQPHCPGGNFVPSSLQKGLRVSGVSHTEAAVSQSGATLVADGNGNEMSRKAPRFDASSAVLGGDATVASQDSANDTSLSDQHRITPPSPPSEPLIDEATRLLGISWQRVDTDHDMAPAVRGWTKYIDNQYSAILHDSQMLMKSRALNAYLVAATPHGACSPSFYLFNEDLTQGQLVASRWEVCLQNLRSTPPVFEGNAVIVAAGRPQPLENPFTSAGESGVPLLQQALSSHSHVAPCGMDLGAGLNQGMDTGMEIDS